MNGGRLVFGRYTSVVSSTTIKVTSQTRDLLKEQAAAAGLSVGEYVARLADDRAREERWVRLRSDLAARPRTSEMAAEDAWWADAALADGLSEEP